ncbi:MAG TPA: flavocytochrome c [Candidatus Ligilactobacillus faecavium]|nr:flavocytochrome c [Candidatus Ligilactobacillus faecavium]
MENQVETIVIGAGCAGLTAALQAHEIGKKVMVLEKMPRIGGNSMRASSGMNAAETDLQLKHGIIDSSEQFYNETFQAGGKMNDPQLLQYFTTHTNGAIEWLKQYDVDLGDLTTLGGMSLARTHRPTDTSPIGAYLVKKLAAAVENAGIEIRTDCKVIDLQRNASGFQLTVIQNETQVHLECRKVILATGGFGASKELIKRYAPQYADFKTTNQDGATGDGLKLAQNLGAQLIQLNLVQIHPTVQQDNPHTYLIGETVRGEGAILVNNAGKRFVNELDTRKKVSNAIIAQPTRHAYLILDRKVFQRVKALEFYQSVGLVEQADSLAELANQINIDQQQLNETVTEWNAAVKKQNDAQFGRHTGMRTLDTAPFYAIHVAPAVHYTMGGIHIDNETHVLDENGNIIPGLFAAGEVAGGLHGNNRVGGNSIAETIVFGRQAGIQSSKD